MRNLAPSDCGSVALDTTCVHRCRILSCTLGGAAVFGLIGVATELPDKVLQSFDAVGR